MANSSITIAITPDMGRNPPRNPMVEEFIKLNINEPKININK
ncbi:hypothetical protein GCM10010233_65520 [Streptomyces pseudogriseolus]|nr:hypothetical protein GCM10010233_65520 [Streptomyces gancidicus]